MHEHSTSLTNTLAAASLKQEPAAASENLQQQPLYTESLQYLPVQYKLTVGAVDDPLEHEADAMADHVMRMPDTSFIQRKCAHCEEEEKVQRKPAVYEPVRQNIEVRRSPAISFIQRKCGCCEDEEAQRKPINPFIQKKENGSGHIAGNTVQRQIQSTKGSGSAMPANTKTFMESRFGADFSNVRIHSGSDASQLSNQLNAQAFTVGNDIYFNSGKFSPETSEGKHLLAHELTHTVQQGSSTVSGVQRKVSPRIGKIRDHLTYGFFDWAITDGDVRAVLKDLQSLSPQDLKDTIAVLEKEGLVGRLYDNLRESDDKNKGWVVSLMQDIQDVRVHNKSDGTKFVGSCTEQEIKKATSKFKPVIDWANNCIAALDKFIAQLPGYQTIGKLLDKYFFHEAQAGVLHPQQRQAFATEIKNRLKILIAGVPTTVVNCASEFDSFCSNGADAYVHGAAVRVCPSYFKGDDQNQTSVLFHELMHRYNQRDGVAGVHDTSYQFERVFQYLPPDRAVGNADSYSTFAEEINLKKRLHDYTEADTLQACNAVPQEDLKRDMAFAMRMKTDAWNEISSLTFSTQNSNNAATSHFKATTHDDLIRFSQRLSGLNLSSVPFHCDASAATKATLPYTSGSGLHLTQPYFNIASENQRVLILLAILFHRYVSGMDSPVWPSGAGYAAQTMDQAYKNPAAFAEYIGDIAIRPAGGGRSEWNFADATVRYGEEFSRITDGITNDLAALYPDDSFQRIVLNGIPAFLAQNLKSPIQNHHELDSNVKAINARIKVVKVFLDIMYRDYPSLHSHNQFAGLSNLPGTSFYESKLDIVTDAEYNNELRVLRQSFNTIILIRIRNNEVLKPEDWIEYNTLLAEYQTKSAHTLSIMETYKPYLQQLHSIKEKYPEFKNKLEASDKVQKLPFKDYINAETNILQNESTFSDQIKNIELNLRQAIREKRKYNKRDPALPNLDILLRKYETQLRKGVAVAKN